MQTELIAIYGAGGFGRELAWLISSCGGNSGDVKVVCFIDDDEKLNRTIINELPVMDLSSAQQEFANLKIISGIGISKTRQLTMEKAATAGFDFSTIIHPGVEKSKWVEIGKGTVICAGTILTTNIKLGQHVQINLNCTIGHDVVMDDYVTLAPGVHVSGCVYLGKRVYVGTGAVFVNGTANNPLVIGNDVIIGAGACVTRSIASGVWGGVPARNLK
jgi:sugar O-acyltransferase (sialic acid O-acetyltransferase NeuD family)